MAEMESVHEPSSIRLTKSSPDNHKIPPEYHDFVAGAVGGSLRRGFSKWCTLSLLDSDKIKTYISVACSHPMDTIKTRLQTTNNYRGITDCAKKMIQKEGLRSLYKG